MVLAMRTKLEQILLHNPSVSGYMMAQIVVGAFIPALSTPLIAFVWFLIPTFYFGWTHGIGAGSKTKRNVPVWKQVYDTMDCLKHNGSREYDVRFKCRGNFNFDLNEFSLNDLHNQLTLNVLTSDPGPTDVLGISIMDEPFIVWSVVSNHKRKEVDLHIIPRLEYFSRA